MSLQLTFGGTSVPLQSSSLAYNHAAWQADLSALSGQEGELSIIRSIQPNVAGFFRLDNLQFIAIPEPSTWALATLGTALFFCTSRRRHRQD